VVPIQLLKEVAVTPVIRLRTVSKDLTRAGMGTRAIPPVRTAVTQFAGWAGQTPIVESNWSFAFAVVVSHFA